MSNHQPRHPSSSSKLPSSGSTPPHLSLLIDLIRTENAFVNDLHVVINRLAAAYSPSNLPPAHLDHHFRLIESIFRLHKTFLSQSLLPIEPDPTHYHLSDLIVLVSSLVHHLLPIYHHRYCHPQGWAGAGGWSFDPTVMSNESLIQALLSVDWPFSAPLPSSSSPPSIDAPQARHPSPPHLSIFPEAPYRLDDLIVYQPNSSVPHATLTVYFALPFIRLIYYRKLTHSLLQLIQPGRPEHQLIYDSSHQVSVLLDRGRSQWSQAPSLRSTATSSRRHTPPTHPIEPSRPQPFNRHPHQQQQTPSIPSSTQSSPSQRFSPIHPPPPQSSYSTKIASSTNLRSSTETTLSVQANSSAASTTDDVFDRTNPSTPLSSSSATFDAQQQASFRANEMVQVNQNVFIQQAILDLQAHLDTRRCLDLFTMTPKQCRLHLAPPTLIHSRTIKCQGDARFKVRPQSDPDREIETASGRLILITDLLMFCEYKDPFFPTKQPEMWLMYPPLASKHLQVSPSVNEANVFAFDVIAMSRESIRVFVSSQIERDNWIQSLQEAIDYAGQIISQPIDPIPPEDCPRSSNEETHRAPKHTQLPALSINVAPPSSGTRSQPISPRMYQTVDRPNSSFARLGSHPPQPSPPPHSNSNQGPLEHSGAGSLEPQGGPRYQLSDDSRIPIDRTMSSNQPGDYQEHPRHVFPGNRISDQPPGSPGAFPEPHRGPMGTGASNPTTQHLGVYDRPGVAHSLRKMPSAHALGALHDSRPYDPPPMPTILNGASLRPVDDPRFSGRVPMRIDPNTIVRPTSTEPYRDRHYRPPSVAISQLQVNERSNVRFRERLTSNLKHESSAGLAGQDDDDEESIPAESPKEPTKSIIAATMKTKVFLKQSHSQWKSLGSAKLTVFVQKPGNSKQLVVNDSKGKTLISTIVLTDGVERVGRTGVAVDLSDRGVRTGIVYMLQMKNESSAGGLFEQLLEGSDRRPKPN